MNTSRIAPRCLAAAVLAGLAFSISANDLNTVLECRDAAALTSPGDAVTNLGRAAGMECRTQEHQREVTVNCTGGQAQAFGQRVKEFNLVRGSRDQALLQVVFTTAPARLQSTFERERAAAATDQPLANAEWGEREDGVAELRCQVPGTGTGAGSIAGTVSFRGVEPVPAMRVCAAPVRSPEQPHCTQTASGQGDYLIENLQPGDYYVTSFAIEQNPNRLFGTFSTRLSDCPDGDPACVGRRLQPVTVFAGDVRSGIDPDTLVERLPPPLREPSGY